MPPAKETPFAFPVERSLGGDRSPTVTTARLTILSRVGSAHSHAGRYTQAVAASVERLQLHDGITTMTIGNFSRGWG